MSVVVVVYGGTGVVASGGRESPTTEMFSIIRAVRVLFRPDRRPGDGGEDDSGGGEDILLGSVGSALVFVHVEGSCNDGPLETGSDWTDWRVAVGVVWWDETIVAAPVATVAEDAVDPSTPFLVTTADGGGFFFSEDRGLPRPFLAVGVGAARIGAPAVPLALARRSGVQSDCFICICGDLAFFALVSSLVVVACDRTEWSLFSVLVLLAWLVVVVIGLLAK
jgi:hypothetical protein